MAVQDSSFLSVIAFPSGEAFHGADTRQCKFSRQERRWTLQADCELSTALDVPKTVTLDGGGHTITLVGDAEGFESAAIRLVGGNVVNLTVDGGELLQEAPAYFAAISLTAPCRISETSVRNIHFTGAPHSAIGIEVTAFDRDTAEVQDVNLENISGVGLFFTGDSEITADGVFTSDVTAGIQVNGKTTTTLTRAVVEGSQVDVLAQDHSCVRIIASIAKGAKVAQDRSIVHHETLTFIGAGDREKTSRRPATVARGLLG